MTARGETPMIARGAEKAELLAENARLRAALAAFVEWHDTGAPNSTGNTRQLYRVVESARAALAEKGVQS